MEAKTTCSPFWRKHLRAAWSRLQKTDRAGRFTIVGVGQELNGDDAAGVLVARKLMERLPKDTGWLILAGGSAPENSTGLIERYHPGLVLLVDAVQGPGQPGQICWIDRTGISGFSGSTHSLPLNVIADYISAVSGCEIGVIGIQPACLEFDVPVSEQVFKAVDKIVGEIIQLSKVR